MDNSGSVTWSAQGRGLDKRHVEAEHNNTEHKKHVVDNTAKQNTTVDIKAEHTNTRGAERRTRDT